MSAESPIPGKFPAARRGTIAASGLLDMTTPNHRSELEISEDMAFQRRTWFVERVGWVILGAILLAAMLGVFGGRGWLTSAELETEDGSLSMHYDRFWRMQSPTRLRIVARSADESATTVHLWIGREYIEAITIAAITPQPDRVEAGIDRFEFVFALDEAGQAATILFGIEANRAWHLGGRIGVVGGDVLSFSQFIYP